MFKMQPQIRYMQIIKNILKKYAYQHGIEATYKGVLDGYCPENSLTLQGLSLGKEQSYKNENDIKIHFNGDKKAYVK